MSQFRAAYPFTCELALPAHEAIFGPAPGGSSYECVNTTDMWGGDIGIVYVPNMAGTYRCAVTYELGLGLNLAVTTHDWRWDPETGTPVEADFQLLETKLDAFYLAMGPVIASTVKVTGYRWTPMKNDGTGPDGPSILFSPRNIAFSATGMNAPQLACSVTEITDVRRRWGRFYLPFLGQGSISGGRVGTGTVDGIAAAATDLAEAVEDTWTSSVYGAKEPTTIPVRQIRVDDVPDVIRSRRWRSPNYRKTLTVT